MLRIVVSAALAVVPVSIAEGKLADLVLLAGDPLQDLEVLQRPTAVLQGGRVVHGRLPDP